MVTVLGCRLLWTDLGTVHRLCSDRRGQDRRAGHRSGDVGIISIFDGVPIVGLTAALPAALNAAPTVALTAASTVALTALAAQEPPA